MLRVDGGRCTKAFRTYGCGFTCKELIAVSANQGTRRNDRHGHALRSGLASGRQVFTTAPSLPAPEKAHRPGAMPGVGDRGPDCMTRGLRIDSRPNMGGRREQLPGVRDEATCVFEAFQQLSDEMAGVAAGGSTRVYRQTVDLF